MRYCLGVILLITLILGACRHRKTLEPHVYNDRLFNFKAIFIYDADQVDTLNKNFYKAIIANSLNAKTDTIKYLKDSIYISCLMPSSGCADYNGDIAFSNDTLKLLMVNTLPYNCSDKNVWRMIYTISNRENKHYIIKKR